MDAAVDTVTTADAELCVSDVSIPEQIVGRDDSQDSDGRLRLSYIVPPAYRQPMVNQAAWSTWYGSPKTVSEVADLLMRLRSPKLNNVRGLATFNVPRGRSVPPATIMLSFLGVASHRHIVAEVMGDDFDRIDLGSKLEFNLGQLLGNKARDQLRTMAQNSDATDLVGHIEKSFPITRSLLQAGAFFRELALPLLYLGALKDRLAESSPKLNQTDRFRVEMALSVLLNALPTPFSGVILGTCESILKVFPEQAAKEDRLIAKRGPMDPNVPLAEQMSESGFATLVQEVVTFHYSSNAGRKQPLPALLNAVEAAALALRPGENALAIVYKQFCDDFALPRWNALTESMLKHAGSMEVPFDHKALPRDLIGRAIEQPKGQTCEAVQLLRGLIQFNYIHMDVEAFTKRADKQLAKARELESQISTLGANLTASAMIKIASLAQAGSEEIMANRSWFKNEVESLSPLVRAWQRFYEEWDRLLRKGTPGANKQTAALAVVEKLHKQPAVHAVATPEVDALQAQVQTLKGLIEQKDIEINDMRVELYNLRLFKDNLALPVHRPEPLALNMDMMRRVAMRDSITPTDVLMFIESVSEGRVVVLDSAWKSAKEASAFQQSVRMLDVITSMVFPYYDSLMAGNPDATARAILGNAYSANESETVSSYRRLRAQREFEYQGEIHFFERHLKVGNGAGLEGMRIHFDIIDGKVVIAYTGPHLECSSSN
ncbi:hypothetical protein HBO38_22810 [Pseudomonas veronii]|uniref:Uncharacterized protein n=1 Tax=Pseudomonas veronii TaxID=76761 RepID=A0A7Y1FAJ8_PSEVE|nr:hypothetical protein [Pseudomonas veronii]NMY11241.1 hypothetical protein [Pseudomonas veronii]